jgi:trk system potassium uptake protein TrkH
MNFRLLCKLLGIVSLLIGGAMVFSLPWAFPAWGYRKHLQYTQPLTFETQGFVALLISIVACLLVGGLLWWLGRHADVKLFRKEAMAVVGLSWVVATVLGAMPYFFAGCARQLDPATGQQVPMNIVDCLFESQSGFSTTGATVISQLEDPAVIPHCILFWRSMTHFLGGLGIIVLFVVILGHGSAGKALMRAEMPGPTKEGATPRMQDTAWLFALTYVGLNVVLALILWLLGLSLFDAACHAFGTMATGGFSTYNASVGHFDNPIIEYVIVAFMILAGTNFTLLFYLICLRPRNLLKDIEWRTYMGIVGVVTILVVIVGLSDGDFNSLPDAVRFGLFQVVSIMTTTGYATDDFDIWNHFGRGVLFMLMFVGGCAGSTGGGLKVIRHVLFVKVLRLEIEQSYHPSVVRPLRLGGKPVEDPDLRKNILVYFCLILAIFSAGWMFVVMCEPDATWRDASQHKLLDSASSVAATLNNIGPGLGTVGATRNYGHFSPWSKMLFLWLMMIGRLEIFSILVLFVPGFWRSR